MTKQFISTISNCKRCGQVFRRQTIAMCVPCAQEIQKATHRVYDYVQKNPGQTIQDIAKACQVMERDIETMIFDNGLGTAASVITVHCYRCNRATPLSQQKGRFCMDCADRVEEGARLDQVLRQNRQPMPPQGRNSSPGPKGRQEGASDNRDGSCYSETKKETLPEPSKEPDDESFNHFGFKRYPH